MDEPSDAEDSDTGYDTFSQASEEEEAEYARQLEVEMIQRREREMLAMELADADPIFHYDVAQSPATHLFSHEKSTGEDEANVSVLAPAYRKLFEGTMSVVCTYNV